MSSTAHPRSQPWYRQRNRREVVFFVAGLIAPALLLYLGLVVWPMAQSFWVALHRWRGVSSDMTFIGFENFQRLAKDPVFLQCVRHNVLFFIWTSVSVLGMALFFSTALARGLRGAAFYRALFLFPNVVSIVAVSVLWRFIYNPNFGILNGLLRLVHLDELAQPWLGLSSSALPAVTVSYVWFVLGFYVLLFFAGLQNISNDVNEAAMIDGASGWTKFRFVTVPLLSDVLRLAVIYLIINCLNTFALVKVMTDGGPDRATEVVLTYLYEKAIMQSDFGYGTAIGATNFVLVLGVTLLIQRCWKPTELA